MGQTVPPVRQGVAFVFEKESRPGPVRRGKNAKALRDGKRGRHAIIDLKLAEENRKRTDVIYLGDDWIIVVQCAPMDSCISA